MFYSLVHGFILLEVDDVEFNSFFTTVFDFEVEPLQMAPSICIDSHEEIVLVLAYLYYCIQVAAFEVALEDQFSVWLDRGVHSLEETGALGLEVGVELAEVCGHVLVVGPHGPLVLEGVLSLHLLMHFEAAAKSVTCR